MKSELNWSYQTTNNAAEKLPKIYKDQRKVMAKRCAYLVSVHNTLLESVVNTDQTEIHLVPIGGSITWETNGAIHVKIHKQDKK